MSDARVLIWRFATIERTPFGFGATEIFGSAPMLRYLMTLPPLLRLGSQFESGFTSKTYTT